MGNISEYLKECSKNVPGNRLTLYINQIRRANSLTVTSDEVAALTVTATGATGKFVRVQADIDSIKFMNEGGGESSYNETQTLEFICGKKTSELIGLKDDLIDGVPCGLMTIRVDNNGQAWLSGWDSATRDGKERPYNRLETSFDSGAAPDDEEGAKMTFRLIRKSGYDELPFDTTLNAAILAGNSTAAAFLKLT